MRFAVDLQKEASVSVNGVHLAGSIQGWNPAKTMMANLYNSNKIYEIILTADSGSYQYKFINGNDWGFTESAINKLVQFFNRFNHGIKLSPKDLKFLDWWMRKLTYECLYAPEMFLFVDQKYFQFYL